jgi:hypothetical protein
VGPGGGPVDINKLIKLQRRIIIQRLLPDLCQIIPSIGENMQIVDGILVSQEPEPRTWVNLGGVTQTDIPCRMTIERAYVPNKLSVQSTVVDRYTLELPADMRGVVDQRDRVMKSGRKYEIRKISDQSEWDGTLELTVVEISADYDHP